MNPGEQWYPREVRVLGTFKIEMEGVFRMKKSMYLKRIVIIQSR